MLQYVHDAIVDSNLTRGATLVLRGSLEVLCSLPSKILVGDQSHPRGDKKLLRTLTPTHGMFH